MTAVAANLTNVMDEIGVRLATITGLRVFDFPPKSAQPPFAFVDMPESITYDNTFQRGSDVTVFKVYVAVGDVVDRSVRDALALYAAGVGTKSVKAAVEASAVYTLMVRSADFGHVTLAGGSYAGVIFSVHSAA